ncbi:hypothetical protein PAHAL_9G108700 [Panicum hallii]|uniref:Uncharacterized protein n=1 Tax=Panicum hallii TaxID=206008 RepID=A0A2T8I0V9_9POAL|nr:hypothetical protein PAHAL_9G108700 [Panicum hallii]PVH31309.1 hypothetical protein PAHAL_9G108700 [Panicum hallii]PVH31310.1 hypothetical protein PAHAL_9G108700 [Panicum hallii]PVH31311.1 hypothetical protein PAHAL_9G108700 [Panicum hallii]
MLHVPLRRPCAGPSADPPPPRRPRPRAPSPPSRRRPPRFRPRRRVSHLRRTVFVSSDSDLVSDHEVSRHPLTSLPGPRMWCLSARLPPHDPQDVIDSLPAQDVIDSLPARRTRALEAFDVLTSGISQYPLNGILDG